MKKIFLLLALPLLAQAQKIDKIITRSETERIETYLASDELAGRKPFTPGIEKAAQFISAEFEKAGLQKTNGSYLQSFPMYQSKVLLVAGGLDEQTLESKQVAIISKEATIQIDEKSGFEVASIKEGENFGQNAYRIMSAKKPTIAFLHESFAKYIPRLSGRGPLRENQSTIIFVVANSIPTKFKVNATQQVEKLQLSNVVGIIPGKSRPNEYVIFSGHYDHLGIGKPVAGDSIYNGANDDAAGTTAVMMLAKYYAKKRNNERTLIFAAFTAEESGGHGSVYFSKQFNPDQVMAMFNLEMIGTESKWGKNSAYITGYEKSSMGEILKKNLAGSPFTFYPDPYLDQNLFYRSDNATLAELGVPAHTISTSKMDSEPNYHKASDEVQTLDLDNMTEIIKAIAKSATSIISGQDTPSRVDTTKLK
ncbi:M28 family peptidase [Aquirufa antheringensis]|uniref:M28 family peptidase n=1 Tax=Aquirufa antheringensis TaxID=2516559 RepID=UPI0022A8302E|nr:M28 family peptidase [Aquirufa antheringensis]MCZ2477749.1 M28 family peptidase [Aquirufa antheringensis]MCZ2487210.1 M28 family peptidase [Aquirufa antheringensis]